jgi:redox-sensitive bicupin YhaK (pirin superfamily)
MGNKEVLRRGDIQLTSAGTGIRHSEMTHGPNPVHFLQIWALPQKSGLPPKYYNRHFTDEEKRDKFVLAVAPVGSEGVNETRNGEGPAPVQAQLRLYSTILSPGKSVTHALLGASNGISDSKAYLHVIQTSGYNEGKASGALVKVNEQLHLSEGDGAFSHGAKGQTITIENISDEPAEVLLFDLE